MKTLLQKTAKSISLIIILLSCTYVRSQTVINNTPGNYSFVVPAGIYSISVETWGAGGGGGSSNNTTANGGSGGGGGAYAKSIYTVTPGNTYYFTVGANGNGALSNTSAASAGNSSWFNSIPSTNSVPTSIVNGTLAVGGGAGYNSSTLPPNNQGLASLSFGNVSTLSGSSGVKGTSSGGGDGGAGANGGAGGTGSTNGGGNGSNGNIQGGGGGGSDDALGKNGGNGAAGQVTITYLSPEIDIKGNATSIVDGDTTPTTTDWTDFGTTQTGIGITRTFTISNTGTSSLTIGAITFSGTNASDFTVTIPPSSSVAVGSSTTFVVTFIPSATGLRTATISIVNDDLNENPYDFSIQGTGTPPPPINDECIAAIPLTVTTSCTYTTYTNALATSSSGAPAPGCASYAGSDVWFSVVVPANGVIKIDTQTGTMTDSGMALYSGSCGSLTLLTCDDDSSTNGLMSYITQSGLTPGQTIYIRLWSFNNSNNGTFGICASTNAPVANDECLGAIDVTINPTIVCTVNTSGTTVSATQSSVGCSGSADDDVWYSFTATDAGHTITVKPTTLVDAVFQVYSGSCGSLTSLACVNASTGTSSEATTINGLTIGNVYYVRVYSNANGSGQGTFTICITSPCTQGNGTSTKTCLDVVAGGLGLSGADPSPINSCTTSTCTNLEATFLQLGNTSSYTVQSIPYAPPYQYTCLRNSVSVDVDDVWSQPVSMPFNFCYYGNTYNNFIISSNGAISFNTVNNTPGGYSAWPITTNLPSATMFLNSIFGVYHDIDPSINGEIGWELITLSSGCRAMVISWGDVPMFSPSCNALTYTGMIVLYENTNIIEVYIKDKKVCSTWNSGNAVVGVQNNTGTVATVAPNRNSLSPDWTTSNEAWRFLPSGASITTVTWYQGSGTTGPVVGNTAVINVCPTTTTTYTAKVEYTLCNGSILTLTDPTTVTVSPVTPIITSTTPGSTNGAGTVTLGATTSTGTISWYANASGGSALGTGTSFTTPSISLTTTYYVESVSGSCISPRVPVIATVIYPDTDSDGIANNIDLDDDNDGISDVLEGSTDNDGDGIINSLDLDSDNDGIGDIIEDQFSTFSNGKDTIDLSLWADINGNGWDDTAEAYYATHSPANFDSDSKANFLDLDSDNDANFDVDEAGIYNGDGDVNCDGKGDGSDSDSDGILNVFDSLVGFGNVSKSLPVNTLGSGNRDYLKVSSQSVGLFDITNTLFASLDTNNDGVIDGATDVDNDGIIDAFDTNIAFFGSPRNLNRKLELDFDGRNDYGQENVQILDNLSSASLMAWVDLNSAFSTDGVIIGQNKFQIRVTSARNIEAVVNSTVLTYSAVALNTSQWYHVGAVYGGGTLKLFLNGTMVASVAASGNIISDGSKLTIGKDASTNTKYFKGKLDEVRVFNVALADVYFQRMVYQEIQNVSSQTRGKTVPVDVGVSFANVLRCYSMDAYKDDIIDDITTTAIDVTGMKIYNNKNIYVQQAPMPFVTERTGNFATAVNSPTNEVRGLDIMDQDWSIVQVKHDITETTNNIDLGMIVDAGVTVTMNNDTKIQNDWYLLLNGKIDLQGKSQLLQTVSSTLDATSAGSIERDQQGTKNLYNYNYWASPVGTINTTTNNNSFTVAGVMKDGTSGTPQNITWTSGVNGSPTSPITLSSYWIFKFQNLSNSYANWASVGQNGTLNAAQGFTLKGSGTASANQNYTFVGKPNNGTITTTVAAGNLNLTGNPYPSALDSANFIIANTTSTTGTLYFWEHSSTNNTHNLVNYQGGYSVRNLVGGTGPTAPAGINGLGTSTKIPGRYVPVGQGFFMVGSSTGGNITFNNNQRLFIKEDNAASTYMFKNTNTNIVANTNTEDPITSDTFKRVRLGLTSKDNYHRQILLGFMDQYATSAVESGYDAPSIDNQLNDMYFINSGAKLNIEGEGYFDVNNVYPIGIKTNVFGEVKIMVDATENMNSNQRLFILDNTDGQYHDITNNPYIVELPQGLTDNRFTLTFKDNHSLLSNDEVDLNTGITIAYANASNIINIKNNVVDATVEKVTLFNLLGQLVATFDVKDQNQQNIQLPIKDLSSGTYIVKVKTDKGETSRKIVFN